MSHYRQFVDSVKRLDTLLTHRQLLRWSAIMALVATAGAAAWPAMGVAFLLLALGALVNFVTIVVNSANLMLDRPDLSLDVILLALVSIPLLVAAMAAVFVILR